MNKEVVKKWLDWELLNICDVSSNTHLCLGHWTLDSWHTLELAVTRSPIVSCHEKKTSQLRWKTENKTKRHAMSVSKGWRRRMGDGDIRRLLFPFHFQGLDSRTHSWGNKNKWKSLDLNPSEMVSIIKDGRDGGHALWCGYIRFLFFLCKATGIRAFQHWWLPSRVTP